MRALLLQPAALYYDGSENPRLQIPVGLLSLAAQLESIDGVEVEVHDARLAARRERGGGGLRFGESAAETERVIQRCRPRVVGISHSFTSQRETTLEAARLAARATAGALVVVGGSAASVEADILLREPAVDCVVIGEGEETLPEILRALADDTSFKRIPGIAFREGDAFVATGKRPPIRDLDALPLPAYHLVDMERYFELQAGGMGPVARERGRRSIPIVTSRGCPYNCVFCSIHTSMGRAWRANSPEYVLRHIEQVVERYAVDLIHFSDDNLGLRPERLEQIVDGLSRSGRGVSWDTPNGLRADRLHRELLLKMKQSGCVGIHIAVESGVQRVLDEVIKKKLDLAEVERVARQCREIGLDLQAFYLVGLPGETSSDIRDTCAYAGRLYRKYGVYPHLSIATPLPGTELMSVCEERGCLCAEVTPRTISVAKQFFGTGLIETPEFSRRDIAREVAHLRRIMMASFVKHSLLHPEKGWSDIRSLLKNPGYLFRKFVVGK